MTDRVLDLATLSNHLWGSANILLIVDASSQFKKGRAQNEMLSNHVDQIFQWCRDYQEVDGVARCVPLDEIKENDWNLNIPRYIEPVIEEETITVAEAIENLKTSLNAAYEAEDKLKTLLKVNGLMK